MLLAVSRSLEKAKVATEGSYNKSVDLTCLTKGLSLSVENL